MEEGVEEKHTEHGQHQSGAQNQGEHGADGAPDPFVIACADILGQQDLTGVGKAHGQKQRQMHHVAANGHGGKAGLSDELTDDDHVHHIVNGLQQVAQQQRK